MFYLSADYKLAYLGIEKVGDEKTEDGSEELEITDLITAQKNIETKLQEIVIINPALSNQVESIANDFEIIMRIAQRG